jgi:hypothetical protein
VPVIDNAHPHGLVGARYRDGKQPWGDVEPDGTVWTWGKNSSGELGIAGESARTPVQVPGMANVRGIAAGDGFTLAVKSDGTVWSWGDTNMGNWELHSPETPQNRCEWTASIEWWRWLPRGGTASP